MADPYYDLDDERPVGPPRRYEDRNNRLREIAAAIIALCGGLALLFQSGAPWPRAERRAPGPAVVVAMLAYAPLLAPLGFLPATALLAAVIALAFGARAVQAAAVGVVTAPALWLLLDKLLDLPLPSGVFRL